MTDDTHLILGIHLKIISQFILHTYRYFPFASFPRQKY